MPAVKVRLGGKARESTESTKLTDPGQEAREMDLSLCEKGTQPPGAARQNRPKERTADRGEGVWGQSFEKMGLGERDIIIASLVLVPIILMGQTNFRRTTIEPTVEPDPPRGSSIPNDGVIAPWLLDPSENPTGGHNPVEPSIGRRQGRADQLLWQTCDTSALTIDAGRPLPWSDAVLFKSALYGGTSEFCAGQSLPFHGDPTTSARVSTQSSPKRCLAAAGRLNCAAQEALGPLDS
ncbi:hypothetical protein PVAR5_0031 [Paecilomyces variotii No. 5]|uniref:Uncharacterized protein n=1 Tax=Byssochlamys spectabilis (strain No. 5 / NBRC 109023) TaxID=1356009 RepID=V5FPG6_BYSSN|nr:hypothetical protein PVAR5_0031 [Paecilomyces variotii No. 5]